MTFKGLRLMLSVIGVAFHTLAAPSTKLLATVPTSAKQKSSVDGPQQAMAAQTVQDTLAELATALVIDGVVGGGWESRKTELHGHEHKPPHHHAIASLIHLLLTIGSAFAPLIGAIVGPLLTNIANGITWAISHTIASGFSPPHGLFSPELGHGIDHIKEHPTSYAAEGQTETGSVGASETQQHVTAEQVAEPSATVVDTRNEAKKI